MDQISIFCKQCNQPRLFTRQGTNHILHLLVSLFLCGLWLPIWFLIAVSNSSNHYNCTFCGFADRPQQFIPNPLAGRTVGKSYAVETTDTVPMHPHLKIFLASIFIGFFVLLLGYTIFVINFDRPQQQSYVATPTPFTLKDTSTPETRKLVGSKTARTARVILSDAGIRKVPNENNPFMISLNIGDEMEVVKQQSAWFYVKRGQVEGWIHGNFIKFN